MTAELRNSIIKIIDRNTGINHATTHYWYRVRLQTTVTQKYQLNFELWDWHEPVFIWQHSLRGATFLSGDLLWLMSSLLVGWLTDKVVNGCWWNSVDGLKRLDFGCDPEFRVDFGSQSRILHHWEIGCKLFWWNFTERWRTLRFWWQSGSGSGSRVPGPGSNTHRVICVRQMAAPFSAKVCAVPAPICLVNY